MDISADVYTFGGSVIVMASGIGMMVRQIRRWHAARDAEDHEWRMIKAALFGSAADPPLPALPGLIASQSDTSEAVARLEVSVEDIKTDVQSLKTEQRRLASQPDTLESVNKKLDRLIGIVNGNETR